MPELLHVVKGYGGRIRKAQPRPRLGGGDPPGKFSDTLKLYGLDLTDTGYLSQLLHRQLNESAEPVG